jgi:hypothetical protein
MDEYGPSTYGDRIAEVYDEWFPESSRAGDVDAAVSFLRELAAAGPALELGIGTGRVAVPLHRDGVEVHGIDASEAMLAKLRTKEGAASIATSVADFRDFELVPRFKLAYVVFNTFFALPTQDDQVRCFQAVARHPDRRWRLRGRGLRAGRVEVRPRSACLGAGSGCRRGQARDLDP